MSFSVDDTMLQNHFEFLYTELEPREIADEMLQASLFTPDDHDYITDNPQRRKRLRNLLEILKIKKDACSIRGFVRENEAYSSSGNIENRQAV